MLQPSETIKNRRETMGFSQKDVAERLGVDKSYVSAVENGKRSLTHEQALLLSEMLDFPVDPLLIASGRVPPDIESLMRNDAAKATIVVRTVTEQTPAEYPTEPRWLPSSKRSRGSVVGAVPAVLSVTKTASAYRAHSYHTKVPPAAITPFIEAFTKPGDTVIDSFCGSGMTGVAARSLGRNSLLSDLSPAAVHIARNYNRYCDPDDLRQAFRSVDEKVRTTMAWLYKPVGQVDQTIEYTVWSDVFACSHCNSEILYWNQRDRSDALECPACKRRSIKADLVWLREVPVETRVSAPGERHSSHAPTPSEIAIIRQLDEEQIHHWVPTLAFDSDREMWRASHGAMGIKTAADFYTRRNLYGLSAIRHAIAGFEDSEIREVLMFAFTACVNRASRRYQWNVKRPTNVMTGTLYISSLRYEWNVWSLFKRKVGDVIRYYESFANDEVHSEVYNRSATDLACVPDGAVDMAFVDPPFGSNIFYADSSLLWDAWLGSKTDQSKEIVVNQRRASADGGKDIADYGSLLTRALSELHRVTKRGGRTIVAFSNSNDRVWEALQDAFSDAGFAVSSVHILDKGQPSIKGVKGQLGSENVTRLDLAINLEKKQSLSPAKGKASTAFLEASIRATIQSGEERPDYIYATALKDALQANLTMAGITMPNIERIRREAANAEAARPVDLVSEYIGATKAIPLSSNPDSVSEAEVDRFVEGGRGSPLYLAHSYHTKVPPESIAPFLEHFTKPGDVVLDPFCGSGMTGVAAGMIGRRAVLNDLSPAAIHIAWNHTNTLDTKELARAFVKLSAALANEAEDLYSTVDDNGHKALIRWTVWSTRHECPKCSSQFDLWETIDKTVGRMGRATACPKCSHEADRKQFKTVSSQPVWVAFQRKDGSLGEHAATPDDVARALSVELPNDAWIPSQPLDGSREMYLRCALHLQGIRNVRDLYTNRNLRALSLIWRELSQVKDPRVRSALAFAFTNTAWHGTKMRRYNARGGHRPMTGTLYVPQLSSEANVFHVMANKIKQLEKYYAAYRAPAGNPASVMLGSATNLSKVSDGSIDYIFTDPPFGSNIFYADCNLVWESWLNRVTDLTLEAVVNKSLSAEKGGKTLGDYESLMTSSLQEMARVLKPGGWATIVFHNTDKDVWHAIQNAANSAGFEFHEASSLGRKQQSHKGYKGRSGAEDVAHYDVVMNLRKPLRNEAASRAKSNSFDVGSLVAAAMSIPEVAARGVQGVHAEVMRKLLSVGATELPDFKDVRKLYRKFA